jgi:hypothetical protein
MLNQKPNNRIKSDSVNLSSFLQKHAKTRKKVAKFTPQFMRALGFHQTRSHFGVI